MRVQRPGGLVQKHHQGSSEDGAGKGNLLDKDKEEFMYYIGSRVEYTGLCRNELFSGVVEKE